MARILVVDDSIESRQLLRELLSWAGHDVFEADDGIVALERLRDHPVDLVVSDILMPVLSGPELITRMRALPAFKAIPVVFWTASYLEVEAQALARECGAACVIMKSGDLPKTLEAIAGALPAGVAPVSPRVPPDKVEPVPWSAELASSRLRDGSSTRLLDLIDRIREISAASGPQAVLDQACHGARLLVA